MTHDLARIPTSLETAHARCEEWAKWVKNTQGLLMTRNSMWDNYRSKSRQWEVDPPIPVSINILAAQEVERAVAVLPSQMRTVLRWVYVWPSLHVNAVCRELGTNRDGLATLRDDGLSRLANSLHIAEFV